MTLYQDACAHGNQLTDGLGYKRAQAWDDISDAIEGARDFIYMTGWSVKTSTKLQRGGDSKTLGKKGLDTRRRPRCKSRNFTDQTAGPGAFT